MDGRQGGGGSLEAAWDEREHSAGIRDRGRPGSRPAGERPAVLPLVRAARSSTLYRFHPFQSHGMLRFATGPGPRPGEGRIVPVRIGVVSPGRYEVARLTDRHYEVLLETTDPVEAVAEAERVLSAY
ncbi:hypothetical protein [Kitasatospora purpeofusca]|uniref:hypothetical protein n=1 Tax=Kitasatospora purpeofusca TaxID=67352 RepID=UPI0036D40EA8